MARCLTDHSKKKYDEWFRTKQRSDNFLQELTRMNWLSGQKLVGIDQDAKECLYYVLSHLMPASIQQERWPSDSLTEVISNAADGQILEICSAIRATLPESGSEAKLNVCCGVNRTNDSIHTVHFTVGIGETKSLIDAALVNIDDTAQKNFCNEADVPISFATTTRIIQLPQIILFERTKRGGRLESNQTIYFEKKIQLLEGARTVSQWESTLNISVEGMKIPTNLKNCSRQKLLNDAKNLDLERKVVYTKLAEMKDPLLDYKDLRLLLQSHIGDDEGGFMLETYHLAESGTAYELIGTVHHHETYYPELKKSGKHYTCYVKRPNGKWYLCDDFNVRETPDSQMETANLLCYRKKLAETSQGNAFTQRLDEEVPMDEPCKNPASSEADFQSDWEDDSLKVTPITLDFQSGGSVAQDDTVTASGQNDDGSEANVGKSKQASKPLPPIQEEDEYDDLTVKPSAPATKRIRSDPMHAKSSAQVVRGAGLTRKQQTKSGKSNDASFSLNSSKTIGVPNSDNTAPESLLGNSDDDHSISCKPTKRSTIKTTQQSTDTTSDSVKIWQLSNLGTYHKETLTLNQAEIANNDLNLKSRVFELNNNKEVLVETESTDLPSGLVGQDRKVRPIQLQSIAQLLQGKSIVSATPTGSGKSYIAVAALNIMRQRRQGKGSIWIFVSTKALRMSWLQELLALGLECTELTSMADAKNKNTEAVPSMEDLKAVVIVCFEKLAQSPKAVEVLIKQHEHRLLCSAVIDEAHGVENMESATEWVIVLLQQLSIDCYIQIQCLSATLDADTTRQICQLITKLDESKFRKCKNLYDVWKQIMTSTPKNAADKPERKNIQKQEIIEMMEVRNLPITCGACLLQVGKKKSKKDKHNDGDKGCGKYYLKQNQCTSTATTVDAESEDDDTNDNSEWNFLKDKQISFKAIDTKPRIVRAQCTLRSNITFSYLDCENNSIADIVASMEDLDRREESGIIFGCYAKADVVTAARGAGANTAIYYGSNDDIATEYEHPRAPDTENGADRKEISNSTVLDRYFARIYRNLLTTQACLEGLDPKRDVIFVVLLTPFPTLQLMAQAAGRAGRTYPNKTVHCLLATNVKKDEFKKIISRLQRSPKVKKDKVMALYTGDACIKESIEKHFNALYDKGRCGVCSFCKKRVYTLPELVGSHRRLTPTLLSELAGTQVIVIVRTVQGKPAAYWRDELDETAFDKMQNDLQRNGIEGLGRNTQKMPRQAALGAIFVRRYVEAADLEDDAPFVLKVPKYPCAIEAVAAFESAEPLQIDATKNVTGLLSKNEVIRFRRMRGTFRVGTETINNAVLNDVLSEDRNLLRALPVDLPFATALVKHVKKHEFRTARICEQNLQVFSKPSNSAASSSARQTDNEDHTATNAALNQVRSNSNTIERNDLSSASSSSRLAPMDFADNPSSTFLSDDISLEYDSPVGAKGNKDDVISLKSSPEKSQSPPDKKRKL